MKILYAIEDRCGAAIQLRRFIQNTSHQVRVAGYYSTSTYIDSIDWNLYAVHNNSHALHELQEDIKNYYPDLVISDGDSIIPKIASYLDIPIIYCSPLHLLDGVIWKKGQKRYSAHLEVVRQRLKKLPCGVSRFIYSPFGDLENSPELHNGFEWIQPYHERVTSNSASIILSTIENDSRRTFFQKVLHNLKYPVSFDRLCNTSYVANIRKASYIFTEGQTEYIGDALYNNVIPIITPNIKDAETLLNATWCTNLKLGMDLGQLELIGRAAASRITEVFDSMCLSACQGMVPQRKKLDERINELWECM